VRYYGQNELDGLPDLVNFIFRTVMMVMGRVEGITADRIKRVNASIPKGHGEPLELARTFALWVAWKRGNEDPPAWAHPDGVLPNSKEEGPPKKLSARALKELERKEAIAAWRVAPDRQSARVRKVNSTATPTPATVPTSAGSGALATSDHQSASSPSQSHHHQSSAPPPPPPPSSASRQTPAPPSSMATMPSPAPVTAMPMNAMMNGHPGAYLSTPKTSVLGPKRVACDTCRKRRIRCKHKDMVMQTSPNGSTSMHYMSPEAQHQFGGAQHQISPELHDNITVTPQRPSYNAVVSDAQNDAMMMMSNVDDESAMSNDDPRQAMPGTNAYVNANIPMAMNGVPMFGGEFSKKGRSKACFECRRSKVLAS
jgi:F-box/leucine-rich repeat protein 10/11